MGVPDSILNKTGSLNSDEWVVMRKHPQLAYDMLSPILYLRPALDIPYCHHEWWDGSGYPRGLKGEEIPLAARIFTVVDIWDALTQDRKYRPEAERRWDHKRAIDYLIEQAGKKLDPRAVRAFLHVLESENR
jgi:HD-GYP domain-containing protein (c-di-GMP phosphodiesterase class II)